MDWKEKQVDMLNMKHFFLRNPEKKLWGRSSICFSDGFQEVVMSQNK